MSKVIYLEDSKDLGELTKEGNVLVDFYGEWCGPCKMLDPILDEVSNETDIKVVKVDVDKFDVLAGEFGVMSVPSLKAFKDGVKVNEASGFQPKELLEGLFK